MVNFSEIMSVISVLLLLLGFVFVVWKMKNKQSQKKDGQSSVRYVKNEKRLYNLHLSASAIGSILAIVHGVTAESLNLVCKVSGLISVILVNVMFIMGIIMGLKSKMQPFGSELDAENENTRKIKWILTGITIITLIVHFIAHML